MTFGQLEILALVVELQSFTAAAQQLGISQSAVSHALGALERELGVSVLQRRQAGIELTAVGARLLPRVREILGLAEGMRQEAAASLGLHSGSLRIGAFGPTATLNLLPRILESYRQRYPDIAVSIDEGSDAEVVRWILERRVDVGFVVLPDERVDTQLLVEDQLVALVPAASPLAGQAAVTLEQLCEGPFIMTEAGSGPLVQQMFARAGLRPRVRHHCAQVLSTLGMVARGEGVAVVAELVLPADGDAALAVRPLLPRQPRRVGLAVPHARHSTPAARAFLQLAAELRKAGVFGDGGNTRPV